MRRRLDAELVRRGMARSRDQAATLIADGMVSVNGSVASKTATQVETSAAITVQQPQDAYVSRGAIKLQGALTRLRPHGLRVDGRMALDAGASTGGFTEVLLRNGATSVLAVDVGYGQLAWQLRNDPRVRVLERTNVRYLTPADVGEPVDLVVADLSFISLALVLPALRRVSRADADFVVMVKPQFEVGKQDLGSGGVVKDAALRAGAVRKICDAGLSLGLGTRDVVASELPGPAGNVEYFLWLAADASAVSDAAIEQAVAEGPI